MHLAKITRRRLHEAQGKPVLIAWPQSAPRPLRGHRYPIYTKEGRAFQIRVEAVKHGTKLKALVKIDGDPFRPMIGLKGTRSEDGAYASEPERVSKTYEDERAIIGLAKTVRLGEAQRAIERPAKGRLAAEARARAQRRLDTVARDAV